MSHVWLWNVWNSGKCLMLRTTGEWPFHLKTGAHSLSKFVSRDCAKSLLHSKYLYRMCGGNLPAVVTWISLEQFFLGGLKVRQVQETSWLPIVCWQGTRRRFHIFLLHEEFYPLAYNATEPADDSGHTALYRILRKHRYENLKSNISVCRKRRW